ncbi:MAG: hypothetical protein ABSF09_08040 [Candidatus Bathyarchaeia archaeon]
MARKATNVSGHISQSKKPQERRVKPESVLLQGGLSESVQKVDLEAKVTELEALLSGTRRDLEVAKVTIGELESKVAQSSSKINELQSELPKSVPTEDLEAVKVQLESKNADLEQKLAASVPRSEANPLRATITELEMKLSRSVPKSEVDALNENASRLEATLSETREKLTLAEAKGRELDSKLSESVSRTELEAAKTAAETRISEIQTQLSESRIEADALREKLAGLEVTESELEAPMMPTEELGSTEPPGITEENSATPSCPSCNASTLQDDVYCGNCGTLL